IDDLKKLTAGTAHLKDRIHSFFSVLGRSYPGKDVFLRENIKAKIERNSFFSELSEEQLDVILNRCEVILYSKGQWVIDRNADPSDDIFLLLEGQCEAVAEGFSGLIQRGSFFGEGALRKNAAREASVRASRASQVLR